MEVLRMAVEELRADNRKLEVSTTTYACLRLFRHFPLYLVLWVRCTMSCLLSMGQFFVGRDGSLFFLRV
ncbi:hypothetical protein C4D60_Mb03t22040 [Musa balbisiana]|uniref:Uncharacterized protein n=1 Tax=Musa balbisiana TaxID=52838 RepID=A0A4S8JBM8_MUSBA|nr:hypothetical protein C4D60_Mb03t22040 [Musa balbisiana]